MNSYRWPKSTKGEVGYAAVSGSFNNSVISADGLGLVKGSMQKYQPVIDIIKYY